MAVHAMGRSRDRHLARDPLARTIHEDRGGGDSTGNARFSQLLRSVGRSENADTGGPIVHRNRLRASRLRNPASRAPHSRSYTGTGTLAAPTGCGVMWLRPTYDISAIAA